ncbi:MAG: SufD family Fe-S cluster assembly protein [Candidatus Micrarchaeia archaeon]
MKRAYIIGDSKYARISGRNIFIRIPENESVNVALRIIDDVMVDIETAPYSKLIASLFCESGDVNIRFNARKSVCIFNTKLQGKDRKFSFNGHNDGGKVSVNNIFSVQSKFYGTVSCASHEDSSTVINNLVLNHKNSVINLDVRSVHTESNSSSDVNMLGVLHEGSVHDFKGDVEVSKNASNTNANLSCKFLKHRDSVLKVLPILKVHNKDARVSHSVSVSDMNPLQVEYLMSRGLTNELSRRLVEEGFISGMLWRMSKIIGDSHE